MRPSFKRALYWVSGVLVTVQLLRHFSPAQWERRKGLRESPMENRLSHKVGHNVVTSHGSWVFSGCGPLIFSEHKLPRVGLISFPGSGNTWIRSILQEVTGLVTGSEYYDLDLYRHGFPAEGMTNGSTLVVKTHGSDEVTRGRYQKVILLMRNPRDAILSEFHRVFGGHRQLASSEDLNQHFQEFATSHLAAWRDFHLGWSRYPRPLLLVLYEDLTSDLEGQLRRLLLFLNMSFTRERMSCAITTSGRWKRPTHNARDNQRVVEQAAPRARSRRLYARARAGFLHRGLHELKRVP